MMCEQQPSTDRFPLIGVGGSAGGLEAFTSLLQELPEDFGGAIIFGLHLARDHQSDLVPILARASRLPVSEASAGVIPQRGHLYIIPASDDVSLEEGCFVLHPRPDTDFPHLPIDTLLVSLARDKRSPAIGVILSGSGNDGTRGAAALKREGGITLVQDSASARFPEMAQCAGAVGGGADFVGSPSEIGRLLVQITRNSLVSSQLAKMVSSSSFGADEISALLKILRDRTGADFSGYKATTVNRRILRRMILSRVSTLGEYIRRVEASPEEARSLFLDILINVTRFFRDPEVFDGLATKVFPGLVETLREASPIRIWIPGCSTGEEAYSVAIALTEYLTANSLPVSFQIFGTDLSAPAIEKARAGIYDEEATAGVSQERLRRFFSKIPGGYQIDKTLRERLVFAVQDVIKDPPFSNLDLICCRNLLIYFNPSIQTRVLAMFHYSLRPGGYLLLGPAEGAGDRSDLFSCIDKKHKMFIRLASSRRQYADMLIDQYYTRGLSIGRKGGRDRVVDSEENLIKLADKVLLKKFGPAGFVVNENLRILQFRGDTSRLLSPAPGSSSLNLMDLLRSDLRTDVRTCVEEVARTTQISRADTSVEIEGRQVPYQIEVLPLPVPEIESRHFIVLLHERQAPHRAAGPGRQWRSSIARWLAPWSSQPEPTLAATRADLERCKNLLRSALEDRDSTTEELRSSNEEILSANEELQSSNEELETTKEELQSINDELHTANQQLSSRHDELKQAHDDLANLIASSQIPVLVVDRAFKIRYVTPAAATLFNLGSQAVGRGIEDLDSYLEDFKLAEATQGVVSAARPCDWRVRMRSGSRFSLRISPFETAGKGVDGAVYSFVDLAFLMTDLERSLMQTASAIVQTVREPLVVLDQTLRVIMANAAFFKTFQVSAQETIGQLLFELGNRQWDIPDLRRQLMEVVPSRKGFDDFAVEHDFPRLGRKSMLLGACELHSDHSTPSLILLAIEDISTRRSDEERLRLVLNASPAGMILAKESGEISLVNQEVLRIFGYSRSELIGMNVKRLIPERLWQECGRQASGDSHNVALAATVQSHELVGRRKDGRDVAIEVFLTSIKAAEEELLAVGILDVGDRKAAEAMQRAKAAAELANKAKGRFLATMSHEIRTPLSAIIGYSNLLMHEHVTASPAIIDYLRIIARNGEHLASLIDDILDLSKIEADQLAIDVKTVNVRKEVEAVLSTLQIKAKRAEIDLALDYDPSVPAAIMTDPARLRQILLNILGNAVKFTKRGSVTLKVNTRSRLLVFTIADTGCGIEPELHTAIFNPFSQVARKGDCSSGGTGLGLTISRRLALLLGGNLILKHSAPGEGSTFEITIALNPAPSDGAEEEAHDPASRQTARGARPLEGYELLLAEDSPDNQLLCRRILEMAGAKVYAVENGAECVKVAVSKTFDAILMDMQMPVLDGYEATRELRAKGLMVPIIALTAHATKEDREKCIAAGCDDYRTKPIEPEDLYRVLEKWHGRRHGSALPVG